MILKLMIDLPEEQSYVRATRLVGRTLLEHLKVVEQDIDEIELVVGELCANVVRHSRSTERRFRMGLEYHADRVVISVEDQGQGFSRESIPPVGAARPDFDAQAEQRIGGYGLKLVELLSDRLDFTHSDPHGTTVRAERRLRFRDDSSPDARGDNIGVSSASAPAAVAR